ncbi:SixA phosphatase family protein, partial [Campylobacter jejuni]
MKKIYIIRHAKASKSGDIDDFERKLTKSGKEDLKKLFKNLASHEIYPDLVLSSPAVRTAKTAKKIAKFYN